LTRTQSLKNSITGFFGHTLTRFCIALFFLFFSGLNSCAHPQFQNDFYRGLQTGTAEYFEKSLTGSNAHIRQASAEILAGLMYEGAEFSDATVKKIRTEAAGSWAAAFDAAGGVPDKNKVLSLLVNSEETDAVPNQAMYYAMRECAKREEFFSETESAAIAGHFSVSQLRYSEALVFFSAFQEEEKWPEKMPALFLEYPVLLSDLGRAFQYTASGNEGLELFLRWEKNLENGPAAEADASVLTDARFRLLFYAGRIARRRGMSDQGISLFERARPLAPTDEQEDACIWYILDSSATRSSDECIRRLEQLVPHWNDGAYFDDILERLSRELTSKKEWKKMIRVFGLIRDRGAAVSTARYAWIIGRSVAEGRLSAEEERLAGEAVNAATGAPVSVFMRIAYNAGDTSLYYRCQSAAALEMPFFDPAADETADKPSASLEFLLGFFSNDAAEFAPRYIKPLEKELTPFELRSVAEALEQAGMYPESMRLVSLYINREGYTQSRRDMELLFPRPYRELVEKYADETGVAPALLFGLIRTESAFQSGVVSHAGAVGLTQLMPPTAKEMADRIRRSGGPDYAAPEDGLDLTDPAVNIHIGAYYLNYLMGRFDDTLLSLLAYNGGMNRVRRWYAAGTLPPDLFLETITIYETREYGRKVMAAAAVYEQLYY
jgi:soluble lytic murein transglycosylase